MLYTAYLLMTVYLVQSDGTTTTDSWFEVEYPSMLECLEAKRHKFHKMKVNWASPLAVRTEIKVKCVEGEQYYAD